MLVEELVGKDAGYRLAQAEDHVHDHPQRNQSGERKPVTPGPARRGIGDRLRRVAYFERHSPP
jgi:hypothetical protein